jgi:hypothetical protein
LCIGARKNFESSGVDWIDDKNFLKECQGWFDRMKGGLIFPHTSCNVNVSRPSTLNRNSYVMKQNALNNDINQSIRTSKGFIDMKSSSTIPNSLCDHNK